MIPLVYTRLGPISCFHQSLVFWGDFNDLMLSLVNETISLRKRNALPALGTSCQVWDVFPTYLVSSDAISTHTIVQPFRE